MIRHPLSSISSGAGSGVTVQDHAQNSEASPSSTHNSETSPSNSQVSTAVARIKIHVLILLSANCTVKGMQNSD